MATTVAMQGLLTLTSLITDAVGIADTVGKNHCISIADTLFLTISDETLLYKQ